VIPQEDTKSKAPAFKNRRLGHPSIQNRSKPGPPVLPCTVPRSHGVVVGQRVSASRAGHTLQSSSVSLRLRAVGPSCPTIFSHYETDNFATKIDITFFMESAIRANVSSVLSTNPLCAYSLR